MLRSLSSVFDRLSAADITALEAEIDHWVYRLYGLTVEETQIVEGQAKV